MALILCLLLGWGRYAHKRSLLEQAVKVAEFQDMIDNSAHWLSDRQILFARGSDHEGLYLYDTRSHNETLLRSVSHRLSVKGEWPEGTFENRVRTLSVSPDGTRLHWGSGVGIYNGPPYIEPIYSAWVDGSHYFKCSPTPAGSGKDYFGDSYARWTADSRHWVAFVNGPDTGGIRAILYDDDPSHKPQTFPAPTSDRSGNRLVDMILSSNDRQSFVHKDHLLTWAMEGYMPMTSAVNIVDIGIGGRTSVKSRSIPLLPDTTLVQVMLSPQRDRIAWQQVREEIPEWIRIVRRWFPRMHMQEVQRESLWVSRIDGTERHEIGGQDRHADEQSTEFLSDLQWVPGSNRLGFRYGAACYTVSAE
ncbi:MAG: hypothetical protein JWN14_3111 [Chthonomonadales bacterium]|nr:hypothetical protein [Chthonomonadales bacterium]